MHSSIVSFQLIETSQPKGTGTPPRSHKVSANESIVYFCGPLHHAICFFPTHGLTSTTARAFSHTRCDGASWHSVHHHLAAHDVFCCDFKARRLHYAGLQLGFCTLRVLEALELKKSSWKVIYMFPRCKSVLHKHTKVEEKKSNANR